MALFGYANIPALNAYIPIYTNGADKIGASTDFECARIPVDAIPLLTNTFTGMSRYSSYTARYRGTFSTVLNTYGSGWIDEMYGGIAFRPRDGLDANISIPGLVRRYGTSDSAIANSTVYMYGRLSASDWWGLSRLDLTDVTGYLEVIITREYANTGSYGFFIRVPGGNYTNYKDAYGYVHNLVAVDLSNPSSPFTTLTIDNFRDYLYIVDEPPPPPIETLLLSLTKPGPNTDDEVASIAGYWTRGTVELKRNESYTFEYRLIMDLLDREKDVPYEDISYKVFISEIMSGFDPVPYPLSPDDPNYEKVNKTFTLVGNTVTISEDCYFPSFTLYASANNVIVQDELLNLCTIRINVTDNLGPYNPDGTTKPGQEGGDGLFGDNINDQIEAPDGSAEGPDGAGLYTRYLVSNATMHVFGDWLWTEDLGLAVAKAAVGLIYGSPADTLISLVSYPFSVGAVAGTGSANVKWGGFDTGITWPTLASNAGTINWGSVSINKFWGNFLDYSPHTKIELYLPWGTGFVEIDTNQVMEGSISVKTNIEFAKGTCVHLVYNHLGSLIGSYSATVGKSLPITASDFASKQVAVAGAAIGLAVGATISAGAGISAGIEGAGQVSYHNIVVPGRAAPITRGAVSGFDTAAASGEFARTLPNAARPALQAAAASTRMPASYHRSGSFQEGSAGLGVQYPFIILSRPKQSMPQSYGHYYGYPCNKVLGLGGCFGYTEVAEVHLDGVPATDAELIEIDRLLKGGVLL